MRDDSRAASEKSEHPPVGVTVLGSTGSIGVNTLDVIARHPHRFRAVALTAKQSDERLFEQCLAHRPDYAVLLDEAAADRLRRRLVDAGGNTEVLCGPEALAQVAALPEVDQVMAAIVGAAGLLPTLAAARAGKRVLLANKETLVMSGDLFMRTVREADAELLPIDSEHNAVHQCLSTQRGAAADGILLTASGGPFRDTPLEQLASVTPDQACAHPNWVMGRKISVDSATMMNKGLEVIEACWLFDFPAERIEVVIHPQSIIHSLVSYGDGSLLAQLGRPDMRTPIAYGLAWPERIDAGVERLDLSAVARLDFRPPDLKRYPCLALAYQALNVGGTAMTLLNAANEVAVEQFLDGRIDYLAIPALIEETLARVSAHPADSLEAILKADQEARQQALELIAQPLARRH